MSVGCQNCKGYTYGATKYKGVPDKCLFHYLFWAHEDSGDSLWVNIPLNIVTLMFNVVFFGGIAVIVVFLLAMITLAFVNGIFYGRWS